MRHLCCKPPTFTPVQFLTIDQNIHEIIREYLDEPSTYLLYQIYLQNCRDLLPLHESFIKYERMLIRRYQGFPEGYYSGRCKKHQKNHKPGDQPAKRRVFHRFCFPRVRGVYIKGGPYKPVRKDPPPRHVPRLPRIPRMRNTRLSD